MSEKTFPPPPEDIVLTCNDGIKLAGQRYRSSSSSSNTKAPHLILCWHGWLDNCRSFYRIGPALAQQLEDGVDLVALDFPGHGKSSHKSKDGVGTTLVEFVYYVHEAIHQLGWENEKITLIGHSMGSSVALMYAAAFNIANLIMLDSLGPRTKKAEDVVSGYKKHIQQRIQGTPPNSVYPSLSDAVKVRCSTAKAFPGKQYISEESARELVVRSSTILHDGKLEFLYDQRLKWTSMLSLSQEQVNQIYLDISRRNDPVDPLQVQTCLLLAKDGMPFPQSTVSNTQELLKPKVCKTLPGSHHFHMDADSSQAVVKEICDFLNDS